MNMHITKIFITSLLIAIVTTTARSQPTKQAVADGQRLYAVHCANCHENAAQGAIKAGFEISIITERGGNQPSDLTDATWDHGSTDAEILKVVKVGMPSVMMPPFKGSLTDTEIRNVLAYVRSLASANATSTGEARKVTSAATKGSQDASTLVV